MEEQSRRKERALGLQKGHRDGKVTDLEMKKGQWAKEHRQPPKAGQDKEMDSPLEPPEETKDCQQLAFSSVRSTQASALENCKKFVLF